VSSRGRRIVRPYGKILRDSEVTARALSFKSVWRLDAETAAETEPGRPLLLHPS
ncbi:hypothetical protein L915_11270, partial [Phytophthora nicotianae]